MVKNVGNNVMGKDEQVDMRSEIDYQKDNKLLLSKLSDWFMLEGQSILSFPILTKYEHILKAELYDFDLTEEFYYKPEYLSDELYETTDLWYLLLFVNDMATVDEFNKPVIKVFGGNTIDIMNDIFNREQGMLGTEENPRDIKKHYLKNLNEPSIEVLPSWMKERYMPFRRYNDFIDELPLIINDKYFRERFRVYEDKFYDEDGKLYEPYRLNEDGLYNMASIYYRDGFKVNTKGKMQFTPGEEYSLFPLFSGKVKMKISDRDDFIVFNEEIENEIKDPIINVDLRKANDESIEHVNTVDTEISSVIFNEETGSYKMMSVRGNSSSRNDFPFAKVTLTRDNPDPQLNLSRLMGNDFFIFNIKYATKYSDINNPNSR